MGKWNEPIDLGIVEFYWLAIFQPKGFLKILEFFIAMLTFSLTAGFVAYGTEQCFSANNVTNHAASYYPFTQITFTNQSGAQQTLDTGIGNGPQYFVAWGVFTLFYCVAAVIVYMTLSTKFVMTGLTSLPDWLVIIDLVITIFWIVMWFIALLVWAVQSHLLQSAIVNSFPGQNYCPVNSTPYVSSNNFAQINISLTFSFLLIFVWICNIYFVLKDTKPYINFCAKRNTKKYASPSPHAAAETY